MAERVTVEVSDGVADVVMNRPEKLNALDTPQFEALIQSGRALAHDPSVRAVVLTGAGRAFCAGLDMTSFQAMAGGRAARAGSDSSLLDGSDESPANFAQRAAYIWQELPVPVIAGVHGVAFGGGCQIALGADIRFVATDTRMSIMEIRWGLIPDMSITQTLRHLGRLDVAKELTFTGRIVEGAEAVELGLATHVVDDPRASALALAREIAGRSPDAVRAAKQLLNTAWVSGVRDGLALEQKLQGTLIGRPNQVEAVSANFEKREPRFRDPA
ncbi:MAG: crotonase/enoyl-CoA hydratase family protein [Myxococcota bacterium]